MSERSGDPAWSDAKAAIRLGKLLSKGEGQSVEFKEQLPLQAHDIGKSIAAFASTNSGVIIFGVSDSGTVVGLENGQLTKVRDQIDQRISSAARGVNPPVQPSIVWVNIEGKAVCMVSIQRGIEPIYYSNQRPIVRRASMSRPAEPSEVAEAFRLRYDKVAQTKILPATLQISKRMKGALKKMNQARSDPFTVSDLALAMQLPSTMDLESVLEGEAPATFDLIDRFCSRFAINKEWLTTGRRAPFSSEVGYLALPEQYARLIEQEKCERVYAVRARSTIGEAFLVIESDAFRVWRTPDVWHVSSHVGGGGSRDLLGLYRIFRDWIEKFPDFMILGRLIEPALARSIWNGETHPGIVTDKPLSHWWDDLTDLDHQWTSRTGAVKDYGKGFVAAQDIIREMISRESG
ncbi:helix-turn-helix domain-containing protein [Polaromonas sp.]|uniref:AlbA family DNA-binding domain-containing protein n=1 Tax=Polaromonas sp. TaxID=1869339 RepID=UPI00352AA660